ncbi:MULTISPECIES: lycopene cyclase domain-containing protein [unclassified Curtobacterium]|uniref:lycopene cyclase domain-containing protein n=1 Tax=unclassified Curtobacterium TaxID=257496 RepID=UPI000DA08898|nr:MULTISPECIES: lycopene cyclase domain-containing protein [unclassified Curtobacterium]PYY39079.1 lycopene cyclase domain-containing protein [Curtobacterium sp. MCPF17_046]PZE91706.1 lycopene cyclase domain-containing protein [Curtobacterium sp. MCBD17_008]
MPGLYLAGLLVSIAGVAVLDARHRLFFWRAPLRAAVVMLIGLAFFMVWDVVGVHLGIFFIGTTPVLTGVLLAPDVPLEEFFFLVLLCWTTMDLFGAVRPVAERLRRRRAAQGTGTVPDVQGGGPV